MHGQKKRRKRFREGSIDVDGVNLHWELLSELQWTSEHGYKGLCISVRMEDGSHRELILEFPFPKKFDSLGIPQLPPTSKILREGNRSRCPPSDSCQVRTCLPWKEIHPSAVLNFELGQEAFFPVFETVRFAFARTVPLRSQSLTSSFNS